MWSKRKLWLSHVLRFIGWMQAEVIIGRNNRLNEYQPPSS